MKLTEQEKRDLNYEKLPKELKQKIDAAFSNPHYNALLAIHIQKSALEQEFIESPFTIRGADAPLEVTEDGVSKAIKEAITSRQNVETALKCAKWLNEVSDEIEKLQQKLTEAEKSEMNEDLKNKRANQYGKTGQIAV